MTLAVSIVIALIVPVIFLFLLRRLDLHKTAKFKKNIATLGCGALAYLLAVQVNRAVANSGLLTWTEIIRYMAPFGEEIFKSLILICLVNRADFNYIVDGALYGFGAGIGFAVFENVEYVRGTETERALFLAVARVFSTNLVHAAGSGLIGAALAFHRGTKDKRLGAYAILGGYAVAIVFHGVFNAMVNAGTFLAVAIGYGMIGAALIWYFIRRGMDEQREWVGEKLGMQDRVTKEETRAVTSIGKMMETLIAPFEERFGGEKVPLVRELLYTQAEMGIKRKLLEATPSPARKKEVEDIIQGLYETMESLRKRIGVYPMMFIREVYLAQSVNAWSVLNARIAESGAGQKGGGVWDLAGRRIEESKAGEENP